MNTKASQERHQRMLLDLVHQPGNDICADCGGRAPRWASWNLGIFLCVRCAGVHRKMGTHISKVKSLTLDTWNREQLDKMKQFGNVKSNQIYNPDKGRNRPPTNMEESERDSELEVFIRRKYEFRRFMDSKPPPVPTKDGFLKLPTSFSNSSIEVPRFRSPTPSKSQSANDGLAPADSILRARTAPIPSSWAEAQKRVAEKATTAAATTAASMSIPCSQNSSQSSCSASSTSTMATSVRTNSSLAAPIVPPVRASSAMASRFGTVMASQQPPQNKQQQQQPSATGSLFDDLTCLVQPSHTASSQPPLQMNPWASLSQAQPPFTGTAPMVQTPIQTNDSIFWAGGANPAASTFSNPPPFRPMLQHVNTLPNVAITPPTGQASQFLHTSASSHSLQYQQQRSTTLGTLAFSTSPASSPVRNNPFLGMQNPTNGVGGGGVGGGQQMGFPTSTNMLAQPFGPPSSSSNVSTLHMGNPGFMANPQSGGAQPNSFNTFTSSMMPLSHPQQEPFTQPMQQPPMYVQSMGMGTGNLWG